MSFEIDVTATLFLLLLGGALVSFWLWRQRYQKPQLFFSNVDDLKPKKKGWRIRLAFLPFSLLVATLVLFSLAFIDPHFYVAKTKERKSPIKQVNLPTEGIAIYLVLDQSGSMGEKIPTLFSKRGKMRKIDLLKQLTTEFVKGNQQLGLKGRPNDLLGLVVFARGAHVLVPLTLDHQAILEQLAKVDRITDKKYDGTAIGYAIFKVANLIAETRHFAEELGEEPSYEIKNAIMVVVTDGFQYPSPLDKGNSLRNIGLLEAAQYAKQQGVKVYLVNVEPRIASDETFAPYRKLLQQAAEITGGKFYLMNDAAGLEKIYADIDRLEKSSLPVQAEYVSPPKSDLPHLYRRVSLYPYFIGLGLFCLFIYLLFETVLIRRVP